MVYVMLYHNMACIVLCVNHRNSHRSCNVKMHHPL